MSATEELERGRLAREVLENRVFAESFQQMQQEIVTRWQNEKREDEREWLWSMMQASKRLESILRDTMNTGELRAHQLRMEQSRAERIGRTLKRAFGN